MPAPVNWRVAFVDTYSWIRILERRA